MTYKPEVSKWMKEHFSNPDWLTILVVGRDIPECVADELPPKCQRGHGDGEVTVGSETIKYVDTPIIPIVNYLNSLDGISTTGSCGGHNDYRPDGGNIVFRGRPPVVAFRCSDLSMVEELRLTFNPPDLPEHADVVFFKKDIWMLKFLHIAALDSIVSQIASTTHKEQ